MAIEREIRYETAGDSDSYSQAFYNNYYANNIPVINDFFSFYKPQFYTYGGTLNYYGQDPFAIFTNTINPAIRFIFTGHTESLSGDSYFVHNIYKLDYPTFKLYGDNQLANSIEIINKESKASGSNSAGVIPAKDLIGVSNIKTGNNVIPQPDKFFGGKIQGNDFNTIQNYFKTPLLTITASTSAVTGFVYDLYLNQYTKQLGKYKEELFEDKAQYFIDTQIIFNTTLGKDYSNYFSINDGGVNTFPWNDNLRISATNSFQHTISGVTFSGISVMGNYFAYFTVPDKPVLEYPIMTGSLSTFTPELRWSNGNNADSFLVQINYNTGDTGFTGTIYNYPVAKTPENTKTITNRIKTPTTETVTDKVIYTAQVSVKSNSNFIYRIGNSREFIDVFDVRRNVVAFSDTFSAISQPDPIRLYVGSESDSVYMTEIGGMITPPSLDYETTDATLVLSGLVSGSTVTGATLNLYLPSSTAFITTTTDINGYFSFSGLPTGIYTLVTMYRGYQNDTRDIEMLSNRSEYIKMKILWSNKYDTWGKLGSENYYV